MAQRDPKGLREWPDLPGFQVLRARWDPPDLQDPRGLLVCPGRPVRPECTAWT